MTEAQPSLYEALLQNFDAELDLHRVSDQEQYVLSVLDNLRRILNSRAGALSHLPDYGLPDMGVILQGLPGSARDLMNSMALTLRKYEPRLYDVQIHLLPEEHPGHLQYALDLQLKSGQRVQFGTRLGPEGKVLVRHLKQQYQAGRP